MLDMHDRGNLDVKGQYDTLAGMTISSCEKRMSSSKNYCSLLIRHSSLNEYTLTMHIRYIDKSTDRFQFLLMESHQLLFRK